MPNNFKDLGSTGRNQWGSIIYVEDPSLTGLSGVRTYDKLKTDPTGALMYSALSLPVRTVKWRVDPASSLPVDVEAADFVWDCFQKVRGGWLALLSNIASMFPYGWSYHEMTLKRRTDGRVGFASIALRPQGTLADWDYADNGDVLGMIQTQATGGQVTIPLAKSLLFRTSDDGGNPEGVSIYRAALRSWEYKRKLEQVEGIGLYRRWAGFPIVTMPKDATMAGQVPEGEVSDQERAEQLIEAIYNDKMMGSYLPDGWGLNFGGPQGNIDTTMGDTIMRKDMEMARAILAQFMLLGLRSVGTQALADSLMQSFELSLEAFLNAIADVFNRDAIPFLLKYNTFEGATGSPKLEHAPVASIDLGKLAQFITALTGAGITFDQNASEFLRSIIPGMPSSNVVDNETETPGKKEKEQIEAAPSAQNEDGMRTFMPALAMYAEAGQGIDVEKLTQISEGNKAAQTSNIDKLKADVGDAWTSLGEAATEEAALQALTQILMGSLQNFHARAVSDISSAFWLGYDGPATRDPSFVLMNEINQADAWSGYGSDGSLRRFNPAGGSTLYGALSDSLEARIAAIILLLRAGRKEEVFSQVDEAWREATQGGSRAGRHAGHVWHAGWTGAVERAKYEDGPVRWRVDPLAQHCTDCARYGGRIYRSIQELLATTGGILPGFGTECDGNCRCSLERLRGGVWGYL